MPVSRYPGQPVGYKQYMVVSEICFITDKIVIRAVITIVHTCSLSMTAIPSSLSIPINIPRTFDHTGSPVDHDHKNCYV